MSPARQKQLTAVAALSIAASALGFIAFGDIGENLVYFWTVDELVSKGDDAKGVQVRLGGVVKKGTYKWNAEGLDLSFQVAAEVKDGKESGTTVNVAAKGAPPQMFREGIGVVVEGSYDGATFNADKVIVKHNNEYKPPAPGRTPQDLYGTLVDET